MDTPSGERPAPPLEDGDGPAPRRRGASTAPRDAVAQGRPTRAAVSAAPRAPHLQHAGRSRVPCLFPRPLELRISNTPVAQGRRCSPFLLHSPAVLSPPVFLGTAPGPCGAVAGLCATLSAAPWGADRNGASPCHAGDAVAGLCASLQVSPPGFPLLACASLASGCAPAMSASRQCLPGLPGSAYLPGSAREWKPPTDRRTDRDRGRQRETECGDGWG